MRVLEFSIFSMLNIAQNLIKKSQYYSEYFFPGLDTIKMGKGSILGSIWFEDFNCERENLKDHVYSIVSRNIHI